MPSPRWMESLDSNPDVMNKCLKQFGVPEKWGISEILSLDEEEISMIPTPCLAVLFRFPKAKNCAKVFMKQEKDLSDDDLFDDVYYIEQTYEGACGTVALIHALANNERHLDLPKDSFFMGFLDSTRDLDPEEIGDMDLCVIHEPYSEDDSTDGLSSNEGDNFHFITIINVKGKLIELDGQGLGPTVHGTTSDDTFLKDALCICRKYLQCTADNLQFNAFTFGSIKSC